MDFRAKVTRAEFEELCSDLLEQVGAPVQQALEAADMTMVSHLPGSMCVVAGSMCGVSAGCTDIVL